jgi:L-amino acid N-acyltransferase YncA
LQSDQSPAKIAKTPMDATIRLAADSDVAAITRLYRPIVESTAISFEIEPPDEKDMRMRIAETLASYPWLVYDVGGAIAGYAYAARHRVRGAYRWSVDTSVYVGDDFRRHGVGRGLYTSLFGILAAQGYFNAYAGIALPNPASVALHESMGFQSLGVYRNVGYKLGAWHDVGWWQLALKQPEVSPQKPVDLRALQNHPDWHSLLLRGLRAIRAEVT